MADALIAGGFVGLALALAAAPALAGTSQPNPAKPQVSASQSLPQDVPFTPSRDVFQPLWFSIDGLWSGKAKVGAGLRQFGVCWQGGAAPYEVRLVDANSSQVFDRKAINATRLLLEPNEIQLSPGVYVLTLTDDTGIAKSGKFTVVEASRLPDGVGPTNHAMERAQELAGMTDYAYAFEAYLTIVPMLDHPSPDARALADRLCHAGS